MSDTARQLYHEYYDRVADANWFGAIMGLILAYASFVRVEALSQHTLWNDEYAALTLASELSYPAMVTDLVVKQPHFPEYFFLLKVWLDLFGHSPRVAGYLSVAFGLVTILLVGLLATEWFSERAGLIAAAVVAANDFHLYWSYNIRMYTLFAALTALSLLLFERQREGESRKFTWAYYGSVVALAYVHYYGMLFAGIHVLALLWDYYERRSGSITRIALLVVSFIPGAAIMLGKIFLDDVLSHAVGSSDTMQVAASAPSLQEGIWYLSYFAIGSFDFGGEFAAIVSLFALGVGGILLTAYRERTRIATLSALLLLGPLAFALTFAIAFDYSNLSPRYLIGSSIPLYIMFGYAVDELPGQLLPAIAVLAAIVPVPLVAFWHHAIAQLF